LRTKLVSYESHFLLSNENPKKKKTNLIDHAFKSHVERKLLNVNERLITVEFHMWVRNLIYSKFWYDYIQWWIYISIAWIYDLKKASINVYKSLCASISCEDKGDLKCRFSIIHIYEVQLLKDNQTRDDRVLLVVTLDFGTELCRDGHRLASWEVWNGNGADEALDEEYTYFLEEIIMYINSRENLEQNKKRVNIYIFENMFKCPSASQNSDPDAKIVSFYELVLIFFSFGWKLKYMKDCL
jgi:hypothetical protein